MEPTFRPYSTSRRDFLRGIAVAGAALLGTGDIAQALRADKSPYAPFRMGIQSYSLRGFKVEEAMQKTKELGLGWWEAFPNHLPLTDDPKQIAQYKEMLKTYGIKLWSYGVVDFQGKEDAVKKFEFAKAMGIKCLSAYPRESQLSILDPLVEEYKIAIAIHNHGPGDFRYDMIDKVVHAVEGHNPLIGACIDTGHELRSHQDPVEAAKRLGTRVWDIHLKDVDADDHFTEIGKGRLDTVGLLKVLKGNGYLKRGILALEYEDHEQDPMSYIQECLTATKAAVAKLNAG
jgi:sugar phosphate isomerase/epimerase